MCATTTSVYNSSLLTDSPGRRRNQKTPQRTFAGFWQRQIDSPKLCVNQMGNAIRCISGDAEGKKRSLPSFKGKPGLFSSLSFQKRKKKRDLNYETNEDDSIRDLSFMSSDNTLNAAFLQRLYRTGSPAFRRTASETTADPRKHGSLKKSSSSRLRSHDDHSFEVRQLVNQEIKIEELETSHFVLVHGGGFGAWCWYKTVSYLQEAGFKVDAVNLTGAGASVSDSNNICTLAQYAKPLTDVLDKLSDDEKVIIVSHDLGGACVSYVMEQHPSNISKAVFVASTMMSNGQSALDLLSQTQQTDSEDPMQKAYLFLYGNGKENPPTSIDLDKEICKDLLFHQSSTRDKALAAVSMRPIPFGPIVEKLVLSKENYGSIRRFYVKTLEDRAIPTWQQEAMIQSNPPEQVFQIKASDHAPFFSKPQSLHRILLQISQIP
ncbi:Putative methylesterase 13, chloroplastic [Linum grandiflorum]